MNLPGYGELFECPYNKAHQLTKSRAQVHLVKCRKNYPNVPKERCPFNATHLVNKPEMQMHVADCPDRASFDQYKYNIADNKPKQQPVVVASAVNYDAVASEDNWDDTNEPTYNPQEYVQQANVIRTLNLAKPSDRVAFREEEVRRLNKLQHNSGK